MVEVNIEKPSILPIYTTFFEGRVSPKVTHFHPHAIYLIVFLHFFSTFFLAAIFLRKWLKNDPAKLTAQEFDPWGTPGGPLEAPQRTQSRKSMKMASQIDDF